MGRSTRMTRGWPDEAGLPVFDAVEPTAEARPIPEGHRPSSGRGPARGAGVAAAALVLLVAGIVVGNPPPSGDPTGSPGQSPEPSVAPSPFVSPAVACGVLPSTSDIAVSLQVGRDLSVVGSDGPDALPPEVHAGLSDQIQMVIAGDACAVSWRIRLWDSKYSTVLHEDSVSNRDEDPAYASQNRWDLPIAGQTGILTALIHFRGVPDIERRWNFITTIEVPELFLVAQDGTRFEASAGCAPSPQQFDPNRYRYDTSGICAFIDYTPGSAALHVDAYRPIHLELPGWPVVTWGAWCGEIWREGAAQFKSPDGCGLGGASADNGLAVLDPPAFAPPPGDTVIQTLIGTVDRAGNGINVLYFAHVIAR